MYVHVRILLSNVLSSLDPSTLSLLQASSVFNAFYWLHIDIRGGVVLLLKMSVESCLDPVFRSSAGYLSHMATKSVVQGLRCHAHILGLTSSTTLQKHINLAQTTTSRRLHFRSVQFHFIFCFSIMTKCGYDA